MSGHSKWSKVKHQKATTDVAKAAAFTKASHAITIAVREGSGVTNPDVNFRLRLAVEKARDANMPKETIERAIAKGRGETGKAIESNFYEGYGPGGVAIIIETATDNRQRTGSAIKNILDRFGGSLGGPGSVAYQFERVGVLVIEKTPQSSFDQMIERAIAAGADDVVDIGDAFEVFTKGTNLMEVKKNLEASGICAGHAEIIMRPTSPMHVTADVQAKIEAMEEYLEELPDVQRVYTNLQ